MSPYMVCSVHGTITPASPQAGDPAQGMLSRGAMSGNAPDVVLRVGHVIEPLGEERGDVPVVAGGAGEDLGVAQPAEPLVALRAVGGHADEVAALAPVDVARNSWPSQSAELSNEPVAGMSECTTRATMSPGPGWPG